VRPRLLTPRFAVLVLGGLAYFAALGSLTPTLPVYVRDVLGGSDLAVGVAAGAFGLSAALLRPFVGGLGDRWGRRLLAVGGSLVISLSILLTLVADSVAMVVAFRLLTGVGEAAAFVGFAAAVQDLAPDGRRGEAASYFSVSVYGGLAIGPILGDALVKTSYDAVWIAGAALGLLGALLALSAPGASETAAATAAEAAVPGAPGERSARVLGILHRSALRPGLILMTGLIGYAGFMAFITLHARNVGMTNSGTVFALFAAMVMALRIVGARLPDRLGPLATSRIATLWSAVALLLLAVWQEPAGIYVATVVYAVGQTFLFPALFVVAVESAPASERSAAIGTFSMFFDLSVFVGGAVTGVAAALGGEPAAFAVGAALCLVAFGLVGPLLGPLVAPRSRVADGGAPLRSVTSGP
jgi:MFS family permease